MASYTPKASSSTKGKTRLFNFTARLDRFRPDRLNLTDKYEAPNISLALSGFHGDNIDNLEGSITLDSLSFETSQQLLP